MAVIFNKDGSILVGMLPVKEEKPVEEKAEKPAPAKKAKKAKAE